MNQRVLDLVDSLAQAIRRNDVACCQWKGRSKRHRWGQGEGDIDLLVARPDVPRFERALLDLGFKRALPGVEPWIPGVWTWYGFDAETGRIVHLHVYHQLLLGDGLTLNNRVPVENSVLESAEETDLFPIPTPAWERILFVLSVSLRTRLLDSLRGRKPAEPEQAIAAALQAMTSASAVRGTLEAHVPWVPWPVFRSCEESLAAGASSWRRLSANQRLLRCFGAHHRMRPSAELLTGLAFRVVRRLNTLAGRAPRKRLSGGGMLIALVGGDGAGKSTAVSGLRAWLSPRFETRTAHLGKPPRSPLAFLVAVARRICALFASGRGNERGNERGDDDGGGGPLLWLRSVCVARDRCRAYAKARRHATNGAIVLCDRYPVAQVTSMDGPNLGRLLGESTKGLLAAFCEGAERRYYGQIMEPDLLIVLRVPPDVAVCRKTDEESNYVRARNDDIWGVDWRGTRAVVIDAGRPSPEVLAELRSLIWSAL